MRSVLSIANWHGYRHFTKQGPLQNKTVLQPMSFSYQLVLESVNTLSFYSRNL